MNETRVCCDCGKAIPADEAPTVIDGPVRCEPCSADAAQSPDAPADRRRWIAVTVGFAGATVALIGATIARKHWEADRAWGEGELGYGDDDLDDEFADFGGWCEDCGDKPWIHYCPECHRVDD